MVQAAQMRPNIAQSMGAKRPKRSDKEKALLTCDVVTCIARQALGCFIYPESYCAYTALGLSGLVFLDALEQGKRPSSTEWFIYSSMLVGLAPFIDTPIKGFLTCDPRSVIICNPSFAILGATSLLLCANKMGKKVIRYHYNKQV